MSLNKLYAYQMGLDCGRNGPNEKNCHFSIFNKREYTDAWEKGKADAEEGNVSKLPTFGTEGEEAGEGDHEAENRR